MEHVNEIDYKIALAEVDEILYFTDESIVSKIPSSFKTFIKENKDKSYVSNINPYMPLEEQDLRPDTKAIISLIYRSYVADEQEKEEFKQKAKEEYEEIEKQKNIKYNPDDIFKQNKTFEEIKGDIEKENSEEQMSLVIVKESFFKRIYDKIKMLFSKHNK